MEDAAPRPEHREQELHDVREVGHHDRLEALPKHVNHAAQDHMPAHHL